MNETDFDESEIFEPMPPRKPAAVRAIALIVIVALIVLSIEGYFYFISPEPRAAVTLAEAQALLPAASADNFSPHDPADVATVLDATRDPIKVIANKIVTSACPSANVICRSKALFYFVRDRIQYVPDDKFHDRLENPLTVLRSGGADCEDMAVLLIALEKAIGNDARLVFVPGHAYAETRLEGDENWKYLEGTCKTCQFNELPESSLFAPKTVHEF